MEFSPGLGHIAEIREMIGLERLRFAQQYLEVAGHTGKPGALVFLHIVDDRSQEHEIVVEDHTASHLQVGVEQ